MLTANQQIDDGFFVSRKEITGLVSGIHSVKTPEEVRDVTARMAGHRFISRYTPGRGLMCKAVLIMEEIRPRNKFYLNLRYDLKDACPVLYYSNKGGIPSAEAIEKMHADSLHKRPIDILKGFKDENFAFKLAQEVAEEFGCPNHTLIIRKIIKNMYDCFIQRDCTCLSLNPLVETDAQTLTTLGCKMEIDDAAIFRQPELGMMMDWA